MDLEIYLRLSEKNSKQCQTEGTIQHCQALQLLAHGMTLSHLLLASNVIPPTVTELVILQNFEHQYKENKSYLK